jgi:hypothetical protein
MKTIANVEIFNVIEMTINFSTCYKVCSIHRIEVVSTSRRNPFFRGISGIVVDCVIDHDVEVGKV